MTDACAALETNSARERRCIVTGEVVPDTRLVRFVVGPENVIVPDVAARLPGRGIWVSSCREALRMAVTKGCFTRAAKATVAVPADLPERVETLIVARMMGDLGLARRSGQLVLGFEAVVQAFSGTRPPAVLVEASDGAEHGRRKLRSLAAGCATPVIGCLTGAELSLALGRGNVVHAALKSGRLSERLLEDAGRLHGFRSASGHTRATIAVGAAGNKGQE